MSIGFFNKRIKLVPEKTFPSDFRAGDVYKMHVALRSHVKSLYFVVIKEVGPTYIVTSIPGHHCLVIKKNTPSWEYHIPRLQYLGPEKNSLYGHLLYNQKNLVPSPNPSSYLIPDYTFKK